MHVVSALPLVATSGALGARVAGQSPWRRKPLSGCKILLVEDEMLVMMGVEDILADLGCTTLLAAATVAEALVIIERDVLDAALVDLNLGGDRSFAVADALAAADVPFAFATGYGAQGLRDVDLRRPLLLKPYGHYDLAVTMTSLVGPR